MLCSAEQAANEYDLLSDASHMSLWLSAERPAAQTPSSSEVTIAPSSVLERSENDLAIMDRVETVFLHDDITEIQSSHGFDAHNLSMGTNGQIPHGLEGTSIPFPAVGVASRFPEFQQQIATSTIPIEWTTYFDMVEQGSREMELERSLFCPEETTTPFAGMDWAQQDPFPTGETATPFSGTEWAQRVAPDTGACMESISPNVSNDQPTPITHSATTSQQLPRGSRWAEDPKSKQMLWDALDKMNKSQVLSELSYLADEPKDPKYGLPLCVFNALKEYIDREGEKFAGKNRRKDIYHKSAYKIFRNLFKRRHDRMARSAQRSRARA